MTTGQDPLYSVVRQVLGARMAAGSYVCVALSGGLDSVVLLHVLVELRAEFPFKLSALHVHHGLSPNADSWAAFCCTLCETLDVPCEVVHLMLPDASGKGLERVAREARYEAFAAAPGDILCLAHHQNDRAETFLLNLFRGAGATGLGGVPDRRQLGNKDLVRPLIDTPRAILEGWATERQLHWIEDESNQNLAFRRNYVRHRIMPAIATVYPGVVGVLARTSAQMMEQATLLDRLAEQDAQTCRNQKGLLSVASLQRQPEPVVRNILRYALAKAGVQIPASRRLAALSAQLLTAETDTAAFVRMGLTGVHLWRDHLWIDSAMDQDLPSPYDVVDGGVAWPDGQLEINGSLSEARGLHVAPLGKGQRFHPHGRCRDRLSELLRAQGLPPWVRARLPAIWRGDALLWVAELGWADAVTQEAMTQQLRIVWIPARNKCL